MNNILQSKIVLVLTAVGAGFALILSLFSGAFILTIFIRMIVGALLMGSLGIGLDYFLRQAVGEEEYSHLFRVDLFSGPSRSNSEKPLSRLDVTEKDDDIQPMSYETMYKEEAVKQTSAKATSDIPDIKFQPQEPVEEMELKVDKTTNNNSPQAQFKPDRVEDLPKAIPVDYEEDLVKEDKNAPLKEELKNLGEVKKEEQFKKASAPSSGESVKFKSGNKNITADSKIIAKAIQTVLKRD